MANSTKTLKSPNRAVDKGKGKLKKGLGTCANALKGFYHRTLDLFFPANIKCVLCGDDLPEVRKIEMCENCAKKLELITEDKCCKHCGSPILGEAKYCFNCKDNSRAFDLSRSVFVYEGEVEKLIAGLKFNNKPYLSRTLGRYLSKLYKELGWSVDLVVPVPMTESRKKWRGYNQAELLATEFCEETGLVLNTQVLRKVRDTDEQKELSFTERQKNIIDAFRVSDKYFVKNKKILLIDDVMTTGATANACAIALKQAHASQVYVLSIAHGKPKLALQSNLENAESVINSVK